jgi:L-amino acid N-acyltransferase YncA
MTTSPTLRLARPDDAAAIAAIYAPLLQHTAVSFEVDPVPADQMADRVVTTLLQYPWLVAEAGGDVLGYAYAAQHRTRAAYRWSTDVSVYLADHARGRGLGRALYTALLDLLTAQGYANAFAGIALPNPASIGLHESLGFVAIGVYRAVGWKLGRWHDVGWWQRRLTTSDAAPRTPIPMPDLAEPIVATALEAGVSIMARA